MGLMHFTSGIPISFWKKIIRTEKKLMTIYNCLNSIYERKSVIKKFEAQVPWFTQIIISFEFHTKEILKPQ